MLGLTAVAYPTRVSPLRNLKPMFHAKVIFYTMLELCMLLNESSAFRIHLSSSRGKNSLTFFFFFDEQCAAGFYSKEFYD